MIPKYLQGKPVDELSSGMVSRLPFWATRAMMNVALKQAQGRMENYGLPKPDHKLGEAHPTISSDLLPRIGHGRIRVKPNLERIDGKRVRFVDGTSEEIDTIVWCTGYRITVPFLGSDVLDTSGNRVALYRRVVHPQRPGLYFIGLVQPLGAIMPIAELQSEWVADLFEGRAALPDVATMREEIESEQRRDAQALRGLPAAHDPGGLPPLHAPAAARAQAHRGREPGAAPPQSRAHRRLMDRCPA